MTPRLLLNQVRPRLLENSPRAPIHYERREQGVMNWTIQMYWIQMDLHAQVLSLQKVTQICGSVLFAMKCIMKKIQRTGWSVGVEGGLMNHVSQT